MSSHSEMTAVLDNRWLMCKLSWLYWYIWTLATFCFMCRCHKNLLVPILMTFYRNSLLHGISHFTECEGFHRSFHGGPGKHGEENCVKFLSNSMVCDVRNLSDPRGNCSPNPLILREALVINTFTSSLIFYVSVVPLSLIRESKTRVEMLCRHR